MRVDIQPYQAEHIPLVKSFNTRLRQGHARMQFPESPCSALLPNIENRRIYQELYILLAQGEMRGGYILKYQDFFIKGQVVRIADYQLPISEGNVNPDFPDIGVLLTIDAIKKEPKLFALGMGGWSEKLPQLLKAMRWKLCEIPFYFKVFHPFAFWRKLAYLRRSPGKRVLADCLAFSGIGWLAVKTLQGLKTQKIRSDPLYANEVPHFDEKTDVLWDQVKHHYPMIAVRDRSTLNILYPESNSHFHRLECYEQQQYIGWVVILYTAMHNHKQLGSMRVGSIVDCLASPDDAGKIISCASRYLRSAGVDLVLSNHSHTVWGQAFSRLGFIVGPSNFLFAASRDLAKLIGAFEDHPGQIYFMRGDGDGPINL